MSSWLSNLFDLFLPTVLKEESLNEMEVVGAELIQVGKELEECAEEFGETFHEKLVREYDEKKKKLVSDESFCIKSKEIWEWESEFSKRLKAMREKKRAQKQEKDQKELEAMRENHYYQMLLEKNCGSSAASGHAYKPPPEPIKPQTQTYKLEENSKCTYCGKVIEKGNVVWKCKCDAVMCFNCYHENKGKCTRYGCKY